jgi:hypothetical protein
MNAYALKAVSGRSSGDDSGNVGAMPVLIADIAGPGDRIEPGKFERILQCRMIGIHSRIENRYDHLASGIRRRESVDVLTRNPCDHSGGVVVDQDLAADLMELTQRDLRQAGYGHYEISSWALPGHGSRHNRVYWSGASWWACGLGSTAGVDGQRLARPRTREAYGAWLQQRAGAQREGLAEVGALPPLDELLLVGLRRREGVNLAWLEATGAWPQGQPLAEALAAPLAPWLERGMVQLEGQQLRLVPPEGFSLSNAVLRDLLVWWEQQGAGQDRPAPPAPSPAGLR